MARDNKVRMPTSGAGITQFYDESKSSFMLKPMHVVALIVLVILIEALLYTYGSMIVG